MKSSKLDLSTKAHQKTNYQLFLKNCTDNVNVIFFFYITYPFRVSLHRWQPVEALKNVICFLANPNPYSSTNLQKLVTLVISFFPLCRIHLHYVLRLLNSPISLSYLCVREISSDFISNILFLSISLKTSSLLVCTFHSIVYIFT